MAVGVPPCTWTSSRAGRELSHHSVVSGVEPLKSRSLVLDLTGSKNLPATAHRLIWQICQCRDVPCGVVEELPAEESNVQPVAKKACMCGVALS